MLKCRGIHFTWGIEIKFEKDTSEWDVAQGGKVRTSFEESGFAKKKKNCWRISSKENKHFRNVYVNELKILSFWLFGNKNLQELNFLQT